MSLPSDPVYLPAPADVAGIELDSDLRALTELLAKNAHDIWARARLRDGWCYGPVRDDARKTHPDLVPYETLAESEKEYDRQTALGTLKAILALGYRIVPAPSGAMPQRTLADDYAGRILSELLPPATPDLGTLIELWRAHTTDRWATRPELYRRLGNHLLQCGSPLLAHDVVSEGLEYWPQDVRLRQLNAWALAQSGAPSRANGILAELRRAGHVDEETLGMLARTHKDLASRAGDPATRQGHLQLAHETYLEAFRRTRGSYSGVNAATTALLLDQQGLARELAQETRAACVIELENASQRGADRYYQLATLGEIALILGDEREAERWYREAAAAGHNRFGDLSSTRRNARLIAQATGRSADLVEAVFPIPRVVVFSGHMIDRPGRTAPRFPANVENAVAAAIMTRLEQLNAGFGYASAACGGDILFLEAMHRLHGKTHVVLPYAKRQFAADSVNLVPGTDWGTRFERALARSDPDVRLATDQKFTAGGVLYEYANLLLLGLAVLHSLALDTELVPMALWDGASGDGAGGTATAVERWRRLGYRVEVIDLREIVRAGAPAASPAPVLRSQVEAANEQQPSGLETQVMAVLFADVVHFSKLSDVEIPSFVEHFLGAIAGLMRRSRHAPLISNTWGDGLYFVFGTTRDAGLFALELCELVGGVAWSTQGLPSDLNLRVALHAGPLFACTDPVTQQLNYTGKHVVPAARLEPITPPGLVYASQEFAALAVADQVKDFSCQPVGRLGLSKGAGVVPVYAVIRQGT